MPVVCISGGMDPVHVGHLDLIKHAAEYGNVVVILNSDAWLKRKKGYHLMTWDERAKILSALRNVSAVVAVDDSDGTVCEALRRIKPDYFANGGDRFPDNTPELKVCLDYNIKPIFNIGGGKVASSSKLVENAHA
jgi:cytidyltransferase-like protein